MTRRVILLCGPPGAGKTTIAHEAGLPVFDRDDAMWHSDAQFRAALTELGRRRGARAVVIRSGATSSARAAAARTIGATHTFVVLEDRDTLRRRIRRRARPDVVATMGGVDTWLARFDRADGVADFPGWGSIDAPPPTATVTSTSW